MPGRSLALPRSDGEKKDDEEEEEEEMEKMHAELQLMSGLIDGHQYTGLRDGLNLMGCGRICVPSRWRYI